MKRLDNVVGKLKELAGIAGKNDKQTYVANNKDDDDFMSLLMYRLNPFFTYKIKKFDEYIMKEKSLTFNEFVGILNDLRMNTINDARRATVIGRLSHADHTYVDVLEGIITKGYSIGMDTGVNKALGYKFIPSFSCMLAAPLKEGDEVLMPAIVELKLDGVRVIGHIEEGKVTLFTRQGRELHFPKIEHELLKLANGEELTFDGELISERRTDISGLCNRNLKSGYTENSESGIKYVLFDVLPTSVFDCQGISKKQEDRTSELQRRFAGHNAKLLEIAPSFVVNTMNELRKISNTYIEDGFEGTIVKDPNAVYFYRRNKAWRKIKVVNSCSLVVTGIEEGKGKRKGKVGALICESSCGSLMVKVGSGLSDAEVDLFTRISPVGRIVEVIYNVIIRGLERDTYSLFLPRFESGNIIRIDKDTADSFAKMKAEHIGAMQI